MKAKRIYPIGLPCNDLERAVKFYTEVLGMKCTKVDYDIDSGGPYEEKYGIVSQIRPAVHAGRDVLGSLPAARDGRARRLRRGDVSFGVGDQLGRLRQGDR